MPQYKRKPHKGRGEDERKQCSKCSEWLPLAEFYQDLSRWDNLQHLCKQCSTQKAIEWTKSHPENFRTRSKRYWDNRQLRANIYPILLLCMIHSTVKEVQDESKAE